MLVLLITFADVGLYKAWGFRIDATPLKYLSSPREVWASIQHLPITAIIIAFLVLYLLMVLLANKLLVKGTLALQGDSKKPASFLLLLLCTAAFIEDKRWGLKTNSLNLQKFC
ncbi:MAG: hypothetical protein EOP51_35145 [Sphingobacteriales bacterium]|nr:MAG: hypothetical protein EOP51_35145 [Sphingobacteriales bacterium]